MIVKVKYWGQAAYKNNINSKIQLKKMKLIKNNTFLQVIMN